MNSAHKRSARTVPYGKRQRDGRLEPDPVTQKIIAGIVAEAARGVPLKLIADGLNKRGVPTHRGVKWGRETIRRILARNGRASSLTSPPAPRPVPSNLLPPSEQIMRDGGFRWSDFVIDHQTGERREYDYWISLAAYDEMQEQVEKLRQMTVAERTDKFSFKDLQPYGFAEAWSPAGNKPDAIVRALTRKTGNDVNRLLDRVHGDKALKMLLRKAVRLLLDELAIQRQVNLVLRQRLIAERPRQRRSPSSC